MKDMKLHFQLVLRKFDKENHEIYETWVDIISKNCVGKIRPIDRTKSPFSTINRPKQEYL